MDSIRQEFRINRKGHRFYGGNWNNGSNNGLFSLNLNNAASNANTNIGGRLAKGKNAPEADIPKGIPPVPFPLGSDVLAAGQPEERNKK